MKRFVIRLLKVTAVVIMMLIMLAIGTFFLVQTDSVQQKLLSYATNLLSQELHTKVEINKISLSLTGGVFKLHGMTVEDQQQQKMLQVEELGVRVALRPLGAAHFSSSSLTLLIPAAMSFSAYTSPTPSMSIIL